MYEDQLKEIITLFNGTISGTGALSGSNKLIHPFKRALLTLNVTAVPQTTPQLLLDVETSEDDTTYFFNRRLADKDRQGNLTRTTAPVDEHLITTVSKHVFELDNLSRYVRLNCVTFSGSGTPATFTVAAKITLYGGK
jgi:hypothetical protein